MAFALPQYKYGGAIAISLVSYILDAMCFPDKNCREKLFQRPEGIYSFFRCSGSAKRCSLRLLPWGIYWYYVHHTYKTSNPLLRL